MNDELEVIAKSFENAKFPEDVFGELDGETVEERLVSLSKQYRRLTKKTHPDHYADDIEMKDLAEEAFKELGKLHKEAEAKLKNGTYGSRFNLISVHAKNHVYKVGEPYSRGDICNLYHCTYSEGGDVHRAIFKISQNSPDNDLVSNEAKVLAHLFSDAKGDEEFHKYLPCLIETFIAGGDTGKTRKHVNVLSFLDGFYSLAEVQHVYPNGVHPADMVWMWKRLLTVMGFAHIKDVIHGAIIPPHIMINPQNHGLVLIDWSYAVVNPVPLRGISRSETETHNKVKAISVDYENFYAPEILKKKVSVSGTDIYMSAKCMIHILGGDVANDSVPDTVPGALRAFLRSCLIEAPTMRPDDAWGLHDEFDELLRRLYGPPKFRPFHMPRK